MHTAINQMPAGKKKKPDAAVMKQHLMYRRRKNRFLILFELSTLTRQSRKRPHVSLTSEFDFAAVYKCVSKVSPIYSINIYLTSNVCRGSVEPRGKQGGDMKRKEEEE